MTLDPSVPEALASVVPEGVASDDALESCQRILHLATRWDVGAAQEVVQYLDNPHPFVRWQAGEALAQMSTGVHQRGRQVRMPAAGHNGTLTLPLLLQIIQTSLEDASPRQRAATADALGRWRNVAVTPVLIAALRDAEAAVRVSAASALGQVGDDAAIGALVRALGDESMWVRRASAEALGTIGSPLAVPALVEALQGTATDGAVSADGCASHLVRASLVCALGHFDSSKARAMLIGATEDPELSVRWQAVRALVRVGDVSALPALKALLHDDAQVAGRTIAELATQAIAAIERRQQGLGNWLRKMFYALWHGWRHRKRQS